jgi:hypothetical protein
MALLRACMVCGSSLGVHFWAWVSAWRRMQAFVLCIAIALPCLAIGEGLDCRVCCVGGGVLTCHAALALAQPPGDGSSRGCV